MKYESNIFAINLQNSNLHVSFSTEASQNADVISGILLLPRLAQAQRKKYESISHFYTQWEYDATSEIHLHVDCKTDKRLGHRYIRWMCAHIGATLGELTTNNFVGDIEIWKRHLKQPTFTVFKKYTLSVMYDDQTPGPFLRINYAGASMVLNKPITELEHENWDLFSRCVFNRKVMSTKYALENLDYPRNAVYPVLNRSLINKLGLSISKHSVKNAFSNTIDEINHFKLQLISSPLWKSTFQPSTNKFYSISPSQIHQLPPESKLLQFGGGYRHHEPGRSVWKGPALQTPRMPIKFMFVAHENDIVQGRELASTMAGKIEKFAGLFENITHIPAIWTDDHIFYKNGDNPMPEIKSQFEAMELDPSVTYAVIYISHIEKYDPNPSRQIIYYRVKEFFLRKGIISQAIQTRNISTSANFRYSLQNIFVALLAKLGGTPWKIAHPTGDDLIVGVGASRSKGNRTTYLGSAFCFNADGKFKEFDCFEKSDVDLIAGAIRNAVLHYVADRGNANRLIIHFYKQMSKKELQPINDMLHELDLEIPVVIVYITDPRSDSTFLIYDLDDPVRILPSGSYCSIPFRKQQYVLFNNLYYHNSAVPKKIHFPLHIRIKCNNGRNLTTNEITVLMAQLYQFSRLYYKSVGFQPMPITTEYPSLVAQQFRHFEARTLPALGKTSLWFL